MKTESLFLFMIIIMGLLWTFINPPFQEPDGISHFYRAYMISEGKFICSNNEAGAAGYNAPTNIRKFILKSGVTEAIIGKKIDINSLKSLSNMRINNERQFVELDGSAIYSPVTYMPQSLGMLIGRIFNMPIIAIFYLARIFNFFTFVVFMYFAIKFIPFLKSTLLLIALMPMTLHQAASISADSITISAGLFLSSYILYLCYSKDITRINNKSISILILLSVVISLAKVTYFLIPLLVFIIPFGKYCSKKRYFIINSFIGIAGLLANGIWLLFLRQIHINFPVNTSEQIYAILRNPFLFVERLWITAFSDSIYTQFFGNLGWLNTPLPIVVCLIFTAGIAVSISSELKQSIPLKPDYLRGMYILSIFIGTCIIIMTSLYVGWYQNADMIIDGIQGRYFIPISILLFYAIYLLAPAVRKIKSTYIYATCIVLVFIISTYTLCIRYYGK